jgi:hypothetical protein
MVTSCPRECLSTLRIRCWNQSIDSSESVSHLRPLSRFVSFTFTSEALKGSDNANFNFTFPTFWQLKASSPFTCLFYIFCLATRLWAGRPGFDSGQGQEIFFSSPWRPDILCGPHSFLSIGYRGPNTWG